MIALVSRFILITALLIIAHKSAYATTKTTCADLWDQPASATVTFKVEKVKHYNSGVNSYSGWMRDRNDKDQRCHVVLETRTDHQINEGDKVTLSGKTSMYLKGKDNHGPKNERGYFIEVHFVSSQTKVGKP